MVRVFSHWFASSTLLQIAFDAILLFLSVMLAAALLNPRDVLRIEAIVPDALLFATTMVILNSIVGLYHRNPGRTMAQTTARIVLSVMLAVPVAWAIFSILPPADGWYDALRVAVPVAFVTLVAIRGLATLSGLAPVLVRRTLVLGTGAEAAAVEKSLSELGPGVRFVGFLPARNGDADTRVHGQKVLAGTTDLIEAARRYRLDEIVVAVRERRGGVLPLRELLDCKLMGIRVLDLSSYYERAVGQIRLDTLHPSWLIFGDGFRQGLLRAFVKRMFDITTALMLLALAIPVMLAAGVLIVLESGFPVVYRQERVGQGGRLFSLIKFRSMRTDAEVDGKPRWAVRNDDRITAVGRQLRKLRIDELPQLLNVLKGDMSLVGPRPERPYFVDQLAREIPFYAVRHCVKPGITGWAQVRYHYGASLDDAAQKLQYDLFYVKNHTLFLDIVVLFETVGVVLSGEGAH